MTTAWNPLVRDGWRRLRELFNIDPRLAAIYAWLHSKVEFGLYNSGKESLTLDLAAHGFEVEHMSRALGKLEELGDIVVAGGSLYMPACLVDTCAAPYSQTQIPRIRNLAASLPGPLLAVWKRDLLDVTARADEERAKRRRGVKESMFERVKVVLGVTLYPVPESTQEPNAQLAWSFDSPPSLHVVAVRTPTEAAAQSAPGCVPGTPLMADRGDRLLGERRQGVSGSDRYAAQPTLMCGVQAEGASRGLHGHREGFGVGQTGAQRLTAAHPTGDRSISLHGAADCGGRGNRSATLAKLEGDDAASRLDTGADDLDEQALCWLALIGDDDGRDTGAGRAVAAQGEDPAAALQHELAREARERATGTGLSADRDRGYRGMAAGRGGQAGAAPSSAGAVSQVVRSGAAGAAKLGLVEVWDELRRLLPELAQPRRYRDRMSGEVSTGLPGLQHHALVDGFVQTQQADPPATMDDFRLLAEWVKAGNLHYLKPVEWCAHLCNSLPVVLDKSAAWKQSGKPESGAQARGTAAIHPAARFLLESIADEMQKEAANGRK